MARSSASRKRATAARKNLKANGKRFRSIESKMKYLRSLRGGKKR